MDKQRRLQKFSIRKYTVGACSILVGTLIFLSSPTHHAFASENTVDATKLEVTEKEKENEVTKAEKEVEETVNTTEATSTNQSATDESTEQAKSKEIGKQQVEQEKVDSIAESSKPEESINKLEVKNEIDNKQEVPVKQDTVEEMEIPKVDEASQPATVTPEVKENKNHNDAVKSEVKTVAKENEQVQKEVVPPEIKEHSQTEKKTTESEQKLDKTETPNKTAVAVKQPREERSIRTRRELRSDDDSAPRENVNNDTSSDNFVITGKAFGKKANDQEVSDYAHIAHSYVKENGDNVEFHYVIHFNKAESNKARGRFYVYAPSFVKLTPGSIQRVTGSGTFNNWKNKALVTGGSKLNSMVYQAMIPVDRDYYRNLTKITDEDNFYYIHEELNHRRNSYIAKMTATVSKDILRKNNGKFYVAIGVATENIARANRANHVNFIENRANVSDADKFNPKGKEQTVELNEIPNAEQSINTYGLPNGTKYVYTSPVDTSTIGNKNTTVRVSYPDGTHDDVPVVLVVNDTVAPVGPTIENQSIEKDKAIDPITIPNATDNSGEIKPTSVTGLPTGLNYNNQTNQITGTPTVEGTNDVTVTYTDTSGNTVTKVFQLNITDTTAPSKPVIQTNLTGKGGTTEPITVQAEPGSKVELFDKDGNKIGEGIANDQGNAVITPTKPLPEGNVTAKATDKAENPNTSDASDSIKVTDTTAPSKPVIQTNLTGKGGTTEPITVQAEPGSKVELFDKDGNKIGESETDGNGIATITPTKPLPEGNVTAKATDKAENPNTSEASEPIKVTDTTPPAKPVIQTDLTGKGGTTDPITVQAEPGSKVELFDKDGNKIGEGETDSNGIATITPTKPLSEGNVTAKATDKAETPNTSEPSDSMKSTDTTAPVKPVIQTDLTGKGGTTDSITVQAEPGSKVELFDKDGNKIGKGETDGNGIATITPTKPLPEGNITAKATDKAENPNTSEPSDSMKVTDTTPPSKPVIQTDLTGKGGTTEPITVQAEPGSKVELFDIDGNKIGEGETDGNGIATITPTKPLPEGNITAIATDKAETPNTSETSDSMKATDTTPPVKPVIQTDLTGKGGTTDPITVQSEPGSKVELFDKDGNKIGESETDSNGIATITPTKPLPEGNITAKATDKAENPNTSEASDSMKATDTTPPAKPKIQTDLTGKGGTTDTITVQAEPGSKVELFDKDGNKIGEGIADDQGNATITPTKPLPEGNVTAKATDKAENPNTSEASDSIMVTNPKDTDDTTDNQDSDINGDGKNNKDESNPSASTPTNNDGDVQPDATTPSQNPSNNSVDEKPGNNNGSDQPNTGGNEQTNNGDGVNNEDVTSTDPTNSDSNGNGISDGGEDADKDDISNKDESNTNNTTSTDNDGDGQPDVTKPSQDSNNNGSNQSNTGNNNPSNADQHKDTNNDNTPNNQDSDIEGNGVNNKDKEVASTDPTNSDSNGNGISDGGEDADKDGISNKDESDSNSTIPTDKDGNGQSNTGNNNPNNTDQYKDTNNDNTPNNQDSDIESNGVNNKDEEVASTDPTNADTNSNGISDGSEDADKDGNNQSKVTTPSQDSNNNGENENPGNNNGSDQPNTGGIEQYKDTDGDGINNKDEETEATDSTESNSNDSGISNGDEDSDKDGISNKDESDSNSTIPTDKDGNTQPDITTSAQDPNNNDSGQSNTDDDNPNNTDQSKDTDDDGTLDNQDTDIDGDGISNINKEISGTNPMNSDTKENGALSNKEKSFDSKDSIQSHIDGNVMTNNSNITNKQSMNKYDKLSSNNDIIKLAAKDDISSEDNGVTNINYELNNVSSMSQQNSNTNLNDQNATNDMSNNNQSSKAHSNIDHEDAKVLPDTGEKESKLASLLGITSLFGGLTLLFRRKKSEDKE
ncbi:MULTISPECIES: Ig-like domain-containing protein [unclassified Mammaliicoccus]|uniref:Ig-like domain-containing protein n=1 Tax=unclassified Mammaliicoccus TaxID=2803851 RepID=UPI001EFB3DFA|nr:MULTISPECIES: Ig-like domain-containing protein [unclassified Mammaliicoccus]